MKQPFVNATINDRRKGKEHLLQTPQPHPARETIIVSPDSPLHIHPLPVSVSVANKPKIAEPVSDLEKMKQELLFAMREADKKKPRAIPKSKLIGMGSASVSEEPTRDYNDILAMLLAKK